MAVGVPVTFNQFLDGGFASIAPTTALVDCRVNFKTLVYNGHLGF